jgi:hypothetical protein
MCTLSISHANQYFGKCFFTVELSGTRPRTHHFCHTCRKDKDLINLRSAMIPFLCLIAVHAVSFTAGAKDKKIKGYATETEDGKTFSEIESAKGKMTIDALLLSDGTFVEVEEGTPARDLPASVSEALTAKYPNAKFAKGEKVTRGSEITYDMSVTEGKSKISFTIDPNGKILKETKNHLKKEKKEDEEEN